mmetsp:Transcript_11400/g.22990  ORF Transcript_11400/g.22990 Transcript_11400/m.22990 type:complete len:248 (-) Transcript_11400:717-1460(-)
MKAVSSVPMPFTASASASTSRAAANRSSISFSSSSMSHMLQSADDPVNASTDCSVIASAPPVGSLRTVIHAIVAFEKLPPISCLSVEARGRPYFFSYASSTPTMLTSSRPPSSRSSWPLLVPHPSTASLSLEATKSSRLSRSALRHAPSLSLILSPMPIRSDSEYLFSYISASRAFCFWLLTPIVSTKTSSSAVLKKPFCVSTYSFSTCSRILASSGSASSGSRSPLSKSMSSRARPEYPLPSSLLM